MHADVPGRAKRLEVSSDMRGRLDPVCRVNHVGNDGLWRVARRRTVEQYVAADFLVGVVVHHQDGQIRDIRQLAYLFVDRGNPAVVRQKSGNQVFGDPVGTMRGMLEPVHCELADLCKRLPCDARDAREGTIEVAVLRDASEGGLEALRGRGYGAGYVGHDTFLGFRCAQRGRPGTSGALNGQSGRGGKRRSLLKQPSFWQRCGAG